MSWRTRFRLRRFVRGSIWLVPVIGGLAGSLCGIAASETGRDLTLPEAWTYSAGTAQAVLASVVGASVGLTGFVVTVAVLIVQMATGTFSARYMRIFYRDKMLKAVLAVLVGTLDLLVLPPAPGGGGLGAEPRRDARRVLARLWRPPLPRLPESLDPPAPARRGRGTRRAGRSAVLRGDAGGGARPRCAALPAGPLRRRDGSRARRSEPASRRRPGRRLSRPRPVRARGKLPCRRATGGRRLRAGRGPRCSRSTPAHRSTARPPSVSGR